jgi:hypothetical protein
VLAVGGLAAQVLGHDPSAAPRCEVGVTGHVAGLHGDVHCAVAHAQHDDVAVGEVVVVGIGVCVHLHAGEAVRAGECGFGPARAPVVAVGHDEGVIATHLPALERDLPAAAVQAPRMLDAGLKRDRLAEAEVVDVVVEVLADVGVVGEVGVAFGHREVRVLHALAAGVDEQPPVGRRHPVLVLEDPVAPDLV